MLFQYAKHRTKYALKYRFLWYISSILYYLSGVIATEWSTLPSVIDDYMVKFVAEQPSDKYREQ